MKKSWNVTKTTKTEPLSLGLSLHNNSNSLIEALGKSPVGHPHQQQQLEHRSTTESRLSVTDHTTPHLHVPTSGTNLKPKPSALLVTSFPTAVSTMPQTWETR